MPIVKRGREQAIKGGNFVEGPKGGKNLNRYLSFRPREEGNSIYEQGHISRHLRVGERLKGRGGRSEVSNILGGEGKVQKEKNPSFTPELSGGKSEKNKQER